MAQIDIKKCPICLEFLNIKEEAAIKYKNRWHHPSCHEIRLEREKNKQSPKEKKVIDPNKNKEDDDVIKVKLYDYINWVLGADANWPLIAQQITSFKNKYGYSYQTIYLALKYFYEVRKNDKSRANGGVGIVPYIHDEALQYYRALQARKQKLATMATPLKQAELRVIDPSLYKKEASSKRDQIDLESL